jgi:hypothetical protein
METAMNDQDLDRIRLVTRHFADLKGLQILVPMGLWWIGSGLSSIYLNPFLTLVSIAGAVGLFFFSRRYYRTRFGEVVPQPTRYSRVFAVVALAVAFCFSLLAPFVMPYLLRHEPIFYLLLYGTMFLVIWILTGAHFAQLYYGVFAGFFFGLALPSVVLPPVLMHSGAIEILFGATAILTGLLDHWLLVRTLKQVGGTGLGAYAEVEAAR